MSGAEYTARTSSAASNYSRGTSSKLAANTALSVAAAADRGLLHPAADTDLWTDAMNGLLFLTGGAALGPSINA